MTDPSVEERLRELAWQHMRRHVSDIQGGYETEAVEAIVARALSALSGEEERPWRHSHAATEMGMCTECDTAAVLDEFEADDPNPGDLA